MNQQPNDTQLWHPRQGPWARIIAGALLLLIVGGLVFMAIYAW